jgi:hypothetical protein
MRPPSYMGSVVDRNVVMRRKHVKTCGEYTVKGAGINNIFTVLEQSKNGNLQHISFKHVQASDFHKYTYKLYTYDIFDTSCVSSTH